MICLESCGSLDQCKRCKVRNQSGQGTLPDDNFKSFRGFCSCGLTCRVGQSDT